MHACMHRYCDKIPYYLLASNSKHLGLVIAALAGWTVKDTNNTSMILKRGLLVHRVLTTKPVTVQILSIQRQSPLLALKSISISTSTYALSSLLIQHVLTYDSLFVMVLCLNMLEPCSIKSTHVT